MVSSAITGANLVSSQDSKVSQTSKSKDSGTDFTAVLTKSVTSNLSDSNKNTSAKMSTQVNTAQKSDTSANTAKSTKTTDTSSDKTSQTGQDTSKTDTVKDSSKDTTKQVADKADDAGKGVYDEIKKDFDVTDEQLNEAMETLGLTMADLLAPNNITQLVVEVTGSDNAMSIVTDESMLSSLKNVMNVLDEQLNNLAQEVELPVEAVKEILNNIDSAAVEVTSQDAVLKTNVTTQQDTQAVAQNAESETDGTDKTVSDVIASKLTVGTDENEDNAASDKGGNALESKSEATDSNVGVTTTLNSVVSDISETFEAALTDASTGVNAADVVDQILESVKLNSTSELKSMEIQLNPQNLGKVNLLVTVREGVITAQITAENEQVRKALESQVSTLKENIQNQGIKVDAVEVSVQTNAFDMNQQQFAEQQQAEQNGRAARRVRLDGLFTDDEDEDEADSVLSVNENSSVEFTA